MLRVKERLDAETIAGGKKGLIRLIPQGHGELASQLVQAGRARFLVEVKGDFAVGPGPKSMAPLFEFVLDRFIAIEFTVDHNPERLVLVRDWLIPSRQVDDAKTGMT